jgi:hypothetical protein
MRHGTAHSRYPAVRRRRFAAPGRALRRQADGRRAGSRPEPADRLLQRPVRHLHRAAGVRQRRSGRLRQRRADRCRPRFMAPCCPASAAPAPVRHRIPLRLQRSDQRGTRAHGRAGHRRGAGRQRNRCGWKCSCPRTWCSSPASTCASRRRRTTFAFLFHGERAGDVNRLQFFIRSVPGGAFSAVAGGREARRRRGAERAARHLLPAPRRPPRLFVAGGTGVAPFLSMLRSMADQPTAQRTTFLIGARTPGHLFALDELQASSARSCGHGPADRRRAGRRCAGCHAGYPTDLIHAARAGPFHPRVPVRPAADGGSRPPRRRGRRPAARGRAVRTLHLTTPIRRDKA